MKMETKMYSENTNGNFRKMATIAHNLKEDFRETPNWANLSDAQKESLDIIASKIARVLVGDPAYREHWDDISEAANLGSNNANMSMPQVTLDIVKAIGSSNE
jgi:hypothetical protein